ncbi:MAG TPA: hypothetical protein DCP97_01840, partial [Ruminococcaceae bacterium]|nr:hypothetical protein [Oscillospiraceae bacterium]
MSKVIALCLDAGHGSNTPGRQSPFTGMKENEFNKAVVGYIKEYCNCNNMIFTDVSPEPTDIPLTTRTSRANSWYDDLKAKYSDLYCLYLSCHANAGGGTGTEIWVHHAAETETVKVAQSVLNEIVSLGLKNRGIKKGFIGNATADYAINRDTNMTSMLIEYAFFDTKSDASLLIDDNFRRQCAKATVKGICNYLGIPFTEFQTAPNAQIAERTANNTNADIKTKVANAISFLQDVYNR